ncbi:hypothetical protein Droror1_Dr00021601 [Drosera rotundifolia]
MMRPAGKQIHGHVVRKGFPSDVYVNNTLINMYACFAIEPAHDRSWMKVRWWISFHGTGFSQAIFNRSVKKAKFVFDSMPERNVIASNSMIEPFGVVDLLVKLAKYLMGWAKRTWSHGVH